MAEELTRGRLLGYGVGSIGTGIVGALPGLLLLIFLVGITVVPVALLAVSLPLLLRFVRTSRSGAPVPA